MRAALKTAAAHLRMTHFRTPVPARGLSQTIVFGIQVLPRDFHPVLSRWWENRFADSADPAAGVLPPTEAQLDGWAAIRRGEHTLIAAPTGSGKTLAAFLTALDELFREGLRDGELPDEVRVIYVSPLKALSADIHKNLAEPRRGRYR